MFTAEECNHYIRLTLKEWGMQHIKVSWSSYPKTKGFFGVYWFGGKKSKSIELNPIILTRFDLFKHVFLHELAHALDHYERGNLIVNGRLNGHGKNFNKWCKKLGIPKGRFIPEKLVSHL